MMSEMMLEVGADAKLNVIGDLRDTTAEVRKDVVVFHTIATSPEFSENVSGDSKEEFAMERRGRGINSIES